MRRALGMVLTVALAVPALAEGPVSSVRPMPRPVSMAVPAASVESTAPQTDAVTSLRPRPRPATIAAAVADAAPVTPGPVAQPVPLLRPRPRPEGLSAPVILAAAPMPAPEPEPAPKSRKKKREKASLKGSVCGDPAIKGEVLAPIKGKVQGCGLAEPVRVTSISGIRLNQPATINCETANAFKTWIEQGLRPALGRREVVEIRVAASYICRTRNNKKGAKISEHGRGKAVDVAGLVFSDGTQWSVKSDYGKELRRAHKAACGIFGTTLGPGSDGYHEDHLHFDTASNRNGPYCR